MKFLRIKIKLKTIESSIVEKTTTISNKQIGDFLPKLIKAKFSKDSKTVYTLLHLLLDTPLYNEFIKHFMPECDYDSFYFGTIIDLELFEAKEIENIIFFRY